MEVGLCPVIFAVLVIFCISYMIKTRQKGSRVWQRQMSWSFTVDLICQTQTEFLMWTFYPRKLSALVPEGTRRKVRTTWRKEEFPQTNTAMALMCHRRSVLGLRHQVFSWNDLQKTKCRIVSLSAGTTFRETRDELIKRKMEPFGFGSVSVVWA